MGVLQPGPAPRFSRTRPEIGSEPQGRGVGSEAVLKDWGFPAAEIAALGKSGVIGTAKAPAWVSAHPGTFRGVTLGCRSA